MTDRQMKFSTFRLFHRFDGQTPREVYDYQIEVVELLEELGFDGVWVASTISATTERSPTPSAC